MVRMCKIWGGGGGGKQIVLWGMWKYFTGSLPILIAKRGYGKTLQEIYKCDFWIRGLVVKLASYTPSRIRPIAG